VKEGDLVLISKLTRWGGVMSAGQTGILINRRYTAYSQDFSKWNVLVDGQVIRVLESKLHVVQDSK
jgi:hypothetical protein